MARLRLFPVHPMFFRVSNMFSVFRREYTDAKTYIRHPEFEVVFDHVNSTLEGSDEEILRDFKRIIRSKYGTYVSKAEAFEMIPQNILRDAAVVRAGVCYFPDRPWSGWDGSLNAVWKNDSPPGRVINTYYSWILSDNLHDFGSLTVEQIALHEDCNAIIRSMILYKVNNPEDAYYVDERIKGVRNASKRRSSRAST